MKSERKELTCGCCVRLAPHISVARVAQSLDFLQEKAQLLIGAEDDKVHDEVGRILDCPNVNESKGRDQLVDPFPGEGL